jgi:hypothetical protein
VVKMNPRNPISRRFPRIVTLPKGYIIITKAGIKFVRDRYSCSVALDKGEIKLYEFLLRILSSDGTLPLTLIRRWRESEILKKALEKHYVTVTTVKRKLPKNEFQELANEIWGRIPEGIYI